MANLIPSNLYVYGHERAGKRSRRTRLEICAQILEYLQFNLLRLSEIAFYVGLNYKAAKRYVELLMKNNLINAVKKNGKTYYVATLSGRKFIKHFEEIN
ncbi:MAG: winged helix-turn-helix domain-containing protein [Candidatus Bathyarchaeia archaeon]